MSPRAARKKPNKLVLAVIAVVHLAAVTLTWRNLRDRPDEQVRGNKTVWRVASALNTLGSAGYWLAGRRPGVEAVSPSSDSPDGGGRPPAPARNRVTPTGEIVAIPLRGAWTGNRGILHDGRDIVRFHASDLWITCALEFRGNWREQWQPHHYTFLFFHDEAVSFSAGHRPCAECRREAYNTYRTAWAAALGVEPPSAKAMNQQLHRERILRGTHRRRLHQLPWTDLPDGTFVMLGLTPAVVAGDQLTEWTPEGYGARRPRPRDGDATVITPPSTVAVLRAGYPVQIDDSAR